MIQAYVSEVSFLSHNLFLHVFAPIAQRVKAKNLFCHA